MNRNPARLYVNRFRLGRAKIPSKFKSPHEGLSKTNNLFSASGMLSYQIVNSVYKALERQAKTPNFGFSVTLLGKSR